MFNDNFLFAFGGRNKKLQHLNLIEVYDIVRDSWKELTYAEKSEWGEGAYLCQAHQISDTEILVFGKAQKDGGGNAAAHLLNTDSGFLRRSGYLEEGSSFTGPGVCYRDHLYFIGSRMKIHTFSIEERKWKCIDRTNT